MSETRTSSSILAVLVAILVGGGIALGLQHARAWDLGGRSPAFSYDAAQYAVAARELAEHGRWATLYALPIELARHPSPPWPLALVQPGLVLAEAGLFRAAGHGATTAERERLAMVLPFACYLVAAVALALVGAIGAAAAGTRGFLAAAAGAVLGFAFLLDPEAQHFATGAFTELPFTLGLVVALAAIALGAAERRPLAFGLVLGLAGLFRGTTLWLAPLLALGAAWSASRERRVRVLLLALLGWAVVLSPWWLYKWRAFGTPAWDLSALSLWHGIGGRTWFSLNHVPEPPIVPHGMEAVGALAGKVARNLPRLLQALALGPRALLAGGLLLWLVATRPARPLAAAAVAALAALAASTLAAALSDPLLRYVFPARAAVEAAGLLAVWSLIARAPAVWVPARARAPIQVALAAIVLGWGGLQHVRGLAEARGVAARRGEPSSTTLVDLARRLDQEVPPGEPVMSNLGPVLAWYARRPVVHLAQSPADVDACRRKLDTRHVLLVFRDPSVAWPEWVPVLERPNEAIHDRDWNVARVSSWRTADGFLVVWLEQGPLAPRLAAAPRRAPQWMSATLRVIRRSSIATCARYTPGGAGRRPVTSPLHRSRHRPAS